MSNSLELGESGTRYVLNDTLRQAFRDRGYLRFEGVLPRKPLSQLNRRLSEELEWAQGSGELFSGGGTVSGHLNCFPGVESRFVYDGLVQSGIIEIVGRLARNSLRMPNIGCNLNLPGSAAQNDHVDGYASQPFLIVNVAAVDTHLDNGAMEILCGSHRSQAQYWQLLRQRPQRQRVCLRQGDVLIRSSTLWHRGMPNPSLKPRPMLAFTWEDGGSSLADPYAVHGGRIAFLPNRYRTDLSSRIREHAFVALPRLGMAYRVVRSLF